MKEIFTRMRLTVMGFNVEYYIQHKYYSKLNTVVWTLDYTRESDLGACVICCVACGGLWSANRSIHPWHLTHGRIIGYTCTRTDDSVGYWHVIPHPDPDRCVHGCGSLPDPPPDADPTHSITPVPPHHHTTGSTGPVCTTPSTCASSRGCRAS